MSKPNADELGFVAIHRWFVDGEGWAYHPWYELKKHELLATLKNELDGRRILGTSDGHRLFKYEAMGGTLFGEQVRDLTCTDAVAADRFPTILRTVYLRASPTDREIDLIARALAQLRADRPGPNSSLKIELHQTALVKTPGPDPNLVNDSAGRKFDSRGSIRRSWSLWAIVLLGMMSPLFWFLGHGFFKQGQNPGSDEEAKKVTAKMAELLKKWQYQGIKTIDRKEPHEIYALFFRFLSQECFHDQLTGQHPDVCFVRRLPERGETPKDLQDLSSVLSARLTRLAKDDAGMSPKEIVAPRSKSTSDLLDEIAERMDYPLWWSSTGMHKYAVDEKVSSEIRRFVYRFNVKESISSDDQSWQGTSAKAMLKPLKKWKVEAVTPDDETERPWFVFHCFFQLLSTERFTPEDLKSDSFYSTFVRRLPEKPLGKCKPFPNEEEFGNHLKKCKPFRNEEEFRNHLKELAERLGAEQSGRVGTLITNIVDSLDYKTWRKTTNIKSPSEEKGSDAINNFVNRFRSNAESD